MVLCTEVQTLKYLFTLVHNSVDATLPTSYRSWSVTDYILISYLLHLHIDYFLLHPLTFEIGTGSRRNAPTR